MPFPMRIQPIDASESGAALVKHAQQPASKSRLRRLFDRPFKRENDAVSVPPSIEPSSLCLDKMVRKFIEEGNNNNNDKAVKCGKNRCNCFNGNSNGSSDDEDELDFFSDSVTANSSSFSDYSDALKSLIPCASAVERNLLADTSRIVEKNSKTCKRKGDLRKAVTEDLISLGYDASVCVSKWEKSPSIPAGEYEYIDVINGGDRLIVDVDFRSEFEIARSTSSYKQILQSLPSIFVGKSDRLLQIVSIAAEAAKLSLKKKGMHIAPWRKAEYMKSKWAGQCTRVPAKSSEDDGELQKSSEEDDKLLPSQDGAVVTLEAEKGDDDIDKASVVGRWENGELDLASGKEEAKTTSSAEVVTWQLPAVRARSLERGSGRVIVTGLASLLKESS